MKKILILFFIVGCGDAPSSNPPSDASTHAPEIPKPELHACKITLFTHSSIQERCLMVASVNACDCGENYCKAFNDEERMEIANRTSVGVTMHFILNRKCELGRFSK